MPEFNEKFIDILTYVISDIIGFAAKLASMAKEKTLTLKNAIIQFFLAVMSCWLVWLLCEKAEQDQVTILIVGCLAGIYSSQVIKMIWDWLKEGAKIILKI